MVEYPCNRSRSYGANKERREEADVRNNAEALVYQTEKFLADNADSVPEDAKSNVEEPLGELKAATHQRNRLDPEHRIPGTYRTVVLTHAVCFAAAIRRFRSPLMFFPCA